VKKSTASIENITPPTERDLGGVRVYLVEATFRLDEPDDQSSIATQVCFEDLDRVSGISHDTARLLKLDWSKSVYPIENGVSLPRSLPIPAGRSAKDSMSCCRMFPNNVLQTVGHIERKKPQNVGAITAPAENLSL
jgi:hypothetical protein